MKLEFFCWKKSITEAIKSPEYNLGYFLASPTGTNRALKMKVLQDSPGFDLSGAVGLL